MRVRCRRMPHHLSRTAEPGICTATGVRCPTCHEEIHSTASGTFTTTTASPITSATSKSRTAPSAFLSRDGRAPVDNGTCPLVVPDPRPLTQRQRNGRMMNILLLGSGGREHALAWKMRRARSSTKLYCAPGNAGIAQEAECVALDVADHAAVIAFCQAQQDRSRGGRAGGAAGAPASSTISKRPASRRSGPSKAAARLEGSKGFTKDLCKANNIPTAAYERFNDAAPAKAYVRAQGRADRGQGRRARRRQGRGGGGDASPRPKPPST